MKGDNTEEWQNGKAEAYDTNNTLVWLNIYNNTHNIQPVDMPHKPFANLSDFYAQFWRAFTDPNPKATAQQKITQVHQGMMLADKYIALFEQYETRCEYNNEVLIDPFRRGLIKWTREKIGFSNNPPNSLARYKERAARYY